VALERLTTLGHGGSGGGDDGSSNIKMVIKYQRLFP
jgi:hypothetical protein